MNDLRILIVEDNPLDVRLIQAFLAKMNVVVCAAGTLAAALERLSGGGVDLVLLDLCLPDSEDLATFLTVHQKVPELPIIVLTGTDDETLALEAMHSGAQDYLVKGKIDPKLLERSIRYAVERKRAEGNIRAYQEQLRRLASEISTTAERERKQIATQLHDNVGQLLAIAMLHLDSLRPHVSPEAAEPLKKLHGFLSEAIRYTRTLISELSPPLLQLGLGAGLEWLAEQCSERYSLPISITGCSQRVSLGEQLDTLLFWSVRELLMNAIKHAQAQQVSVSLLPDAEGWSIRVEDDGVGFDVQLMRLRPDRQGGFGLFNVHERIVSAGGRMSIDSKPGNGTRITLQMPVSRYN